jgi:hypothetical protein
MTAEGNYLRKYTPYLAVVAIAVAVIAATPADKSKTFSVTADTIEGLFLPALLHVRSGALDAPLQRRAAVLREELPRLQSPQ